MHKDITDRLEAAQLLADMNLKGPLVVDSMLDESVSVYGALPERLIVLSPGGTISYFGQGGPWGYFLNEVDGVLKTLV